MASVLSRAAGAAVRRAPGGLLERTAGSPRGLRPALRRAGAALRPGRGGGVRRRGRLGAAAGRRPRGAVERSSSTGPPRARRHGRDRRRRRSSSSGSAWPTSCAWRRGSSTRVARCSRGGWTSRATSPWRCAWARCSASGPRSDRPVVGATAGGQRCAMPTQQTRQTGRFSRPGATSSPSGRFGRVRSPSGRFGRASGTGRPSRPSRPSSSSRGIPSVRRRPQQKAPRRRRR